MRGKRLASVAAAKRYSVSRGIILHTMRSNLMDERSITQHIVHRCIVILISPAERRSPITQKAPVTVLRVPTRSTLSPRLGNIIMIYAEVVSRVTSALILTRLSCAYVFVKNVSSQLLQLQSTNVETLPPPPQLQALSSTVLMCRGGIKLSPVTTSERL
jgi:hypothetical protein